jgi:hypothetical protein
LSNDLRNCAAALAIVASFWTRPAIADEPGNADYAALNKAIVDGKEFRMHGRGGTSGQGEHAV